MIGPIHVERTDEGGTATDPDIGGPWFSQRQPIIYGYGPNGQTVWVGGYGQTHDELADHFGINRADSRGTLWPQGGNLPSGNVLPPNHLSWLDKRLKPEWQEAIAELLGGASTNPETEEAWRFGSEAISSPSEANSQLSLGDQPGINEKGLEAPRIIESPKGTRVIDEGYTNRRPFIYRPDHHEVRIGQPGYHHGDLLDEAGIPWDHDEGVSYGAINLNNGVVSHWNGPDWPDSVEDNMREWVRVNHPELWGGYVPEDEANWKFGATQGRNGGFPYRSEHEEETTQIAQPWRPGLVGKAVILNGAPVVWAVTDNEEPHHPQVDDYSGRETNESVIYPDGKVYGYHATREGLQAIADFIGGYVDPGNPGLYRFGANDGFSYRLAYEDGDLLQFDDTFKTMKGTAPCNNCGRTANMLSIPGPHFCLACRDKLTPGWDRSTGEHGPFGQGTEVDTIQTGSSTKTASEYGLPPGAAPWQSGVTGRAILGPNGEFHAWTPDYEYIDEHSEELEDLGLDEWHHGDMERWLESKGHDWTGDSRIKYLYIDPAGFTWHHQPMSDIQKSVLKNNGIKLRDNSWRFGSIYGIKPGEQDPVAYEPGTRVIELNDGRWVLGTQHHHQIAKQYRLNPEDINRYGYRTYRHQNTDPRWVWLNPAQADMRNGWIFGKTAKSWSVQDWTNHPFPDEAADFVTRGNHPIVFDMKKNIAHVGPLNSYHSTVEGWAVPSWDPDRYKYARAYGDSGEVGELYPGQVPHEALEAVAGHLNTTQGTQRWYSQAPVDNGNDWKFGARTYEIIEGRPRDLGYGKESPMGLRRPFLMGRDRSKIYLGQPGTHHADLFYEFGPDQIDWTSHGSVWGDGRLGDMAPSTPPSAAFAVANHMGYSEPKLQYDQGELKFGAVEGYKWVWDPYRERGFAEPYSSKEPIYHTDLVTQAENRLNEERDYGPSDYLVGVIGPGGEVEWYGGEMPGKKQMEWLKTLNPKAHPSMDYKELPWDRREEGYGWRFASSHNWQPGSPGKGVIVNNEPITWNVREPRHFDPFRADSPQYWGPHHSDILYDMGIDEEADRELWDSPVYINAKGEVFPMNFWDSGPMDLEMFRQLGLTPVEQKQDEWKFSSSLPAIHEIDTGIEGSEYGRPILYDTKNNKLYIGSDESLHWGLIDEVPELRSVFGTDSEYGPPPAEDKPFLYARMHESEAGEKGTIDIHSIHPHYQAMMQQALVNHFGYPFDEHIHDANWPLQEWKFGAITDEWPKQPKPKKRPRLIEQAFPWMKEDEKDEEEEQQEEEAKST